MRIERLSIALAACIAVLLTSCGGTDLRVPDLALSDWFGDPSGIIEGSATDGEFVADLDGALEDRGDVQGLGRGGLTLAGLSVEEGELNDVAEEADVGPAQTVYQRPAYVGVRVYVSRQPFEPPYWDQSARILLGARIPVTFDEETESYLFSGDFEILRKNDDLIDAVASAETVYVALVARVFDAEGVRIGRTFQIRMKGLIATPRVATSN